MLYRDTYIVIVVSPVFLSLVHRRTLLLRAGLQGPEAPLGQHGRADRVGHQHSVHLLRGRAVGGHGGEGQGEPHHLLRHAAHALRLHLAGPLAGADSEGMAPHEMLSDL